MSNPRSGRFYRPLLDDIHRVAAAWKRRWRVARVRPRWIALAAVLLLAGLVPLHFTRSYGLYLDATIHPSERLTVDALDEMGAFWPVDEEGHVIVIQARSIDDDDLDVFHQLPRLRLVQLKDAKITDQGVDRLQNALPDCSIINYAP